MFKNLSVPTIPNHPWQNIALDDIKNNNKLISASVSDQVEKADKNKNIIAAEQVWRTLLSLQSIVSSDVHEKNKKILMNAFLTADVKKHPACRSLFKKITTKFQCCNLEKLPIICDAVTKIIKDEPVDNSAIFHEFISEHYSINFHPGLLEEDSEEFAENFTQDFNKKYEKYKEDRS